jgi:hypothetical protein
MLTRLLSERLRNIQYMIRIKCEPLLKFENAYYPFNQGEYFSLQELARKIRVNLCMQFQKNSLPTSYEYRSNQCLFNQS